MTAIMTDEETSDVWSYPPATPVSQVSLMITPAPLPLSDAERTAVVESWQAKVAHNPNLWNGSAFLFHKHALESGRHFLAEGHQTDFATFLHLRDLGAFGESFVHVFPVGAIGTADRRLVIGRMSPKTANPGKLYPPAGSFDASDLHGDRLDPLANILREAKEEIGLTLDPTCVAPDWLVMPSGRGRFALVTVIRVDMSAAEVETIARAHMAEDHEDELSDVLFVPFGTHVPEAETVGYVNPLLTYMGERY
jgi:8-oxo-dGTP pyrophosphatase MutT (NUDIX family)